MLHFSWMKLLLRLHPPSPPQTLEHTCTCLSDMVWHYCDGLKHHLQLSTLHLLNSHKHNGTQGTTVWTWEKGKWIRVQTALAERLISVPIIHIRGSQSPDAQLWGHLTPLVSEHTHLHSHTHAHCQTITHTHYFKTNKIKIEGVSGFNCFTTLEKGDAD